MMEEEAMRLRIRITGAVQGVGFRPHIYRMAVSAGLTGSVLNSAQGVLIEVEGCDEAVDLFASELREHPPSNAVVTTFLSQRIPDQHSSTFEILHSDDSGEPAAFLLPDLAICPACLDDIRDPHNRRHLYPFTTCTHCGPRYSIVEGLPFDRPRTAMRCFPMCRKCEAEYRNPGDRRFHAQTNCCPTCGPHLELWSAGGDVLALRHDALLLAARAVREGRIVALKGIGGFHLICDARSAEAIRTLRARKHRPSKPFAVMFPDHPEPLLRSPQSPIVLVENTTELPDEIAPRNPFLGVMIAYSPLHAILLDELNCPIIATSGNLTDEPICIDPHEALDRLRGIADLFLVHDRPILRPVDDSIVRVIDGHPVLLRRARGYAPLPFPSPIDLPETLATGAHMKNTVAFSRGRLVFLSQHLGDLSTPSALESHRRCLDDLRRTYDLQPQSVACDLHPDYGSTRAARSLELPVHPIQHHVAHVFAGILEHHIEPPLLGVSWDGSGFGQDATVWGGEYLLYNDDGLRRFAHLRTFPLPGGESAVREPRRSLLGILHEINRTDLARPLFTEEEWRILQASLARRINAPLTSSAGRLFDAIAALLGLCTISTFEGEAAMLLEFAARESRCTDTIAFDTDWTPLIETLAASILPVADRAALFHNALADSIVRTAMSCGTPQVLLTGGCFQNALLTEQAAARLRAAGFTVFTHQALPPNDGAIAAGQILASALQDSHPCA